MILINVKFRVKPEAAATFLEDIAWFTTASREEPGNLFFEWYRDPQVDNEFLLIEAFQDDAAEPHVNSEHFQRATREMPGYLLETPQIINTLIAGKTEWDRMAEFKVRNLSSRSESCPGGGKTRAKVIRRGVDLGDPGPGSRS